MRLGIFGGSFNPVHVGHLRMAIEVREALGLDRVDLVPCANPPHKAATGMLPYGLRRRIVQTAVAQTPGLAVSDLEAVLPEPSYTFRTLTGYERILPEAELFFLMGISDLLDLVKWHRGPELADLAHLVVVPRFGLGLGEVERFVAEFWPDARRDDACGDPGEYAAVWRFPSERRLYQLDVTRFDVSATGVRRRWLAGRSISFLVPPEAEDLLVAQRDEVTRIWAESPAGEAVSCAVAEVRK